MSGLGRRVRYALAHPSAALAYARRLPSRLTADDAAKRTRDAGEFWSESEGDEAVADMSHWRGKGRWDDEQWYGVGRRHVAMLEQLAGACGQELGGGALLEWGGGGGSNLLAFREHFARVYDVDISQANLDEVARQFEEHGKDGLTTIHIEPEQVASVPGRVGEALDVFLCTAVFQHFPGKDYGLEVLRCAAGMLKPGGLSLVQIRYDNGNRRYAAKDRDYKTQFLTFTSYAIDEFWQACSAEGLQPIAVRLNPDVNYAFFGLRKIAPTQDPAP
ncbi:MAG: class I SAM-dependent methyltransferase [Planctomycetota bacterium]